MSEHILTRKYQAHKHHTHTHAASGWRIHCGVEATELSTNKQHTLSHLTNHPVALSLTDEAIRTMNTTDRGTEARKSAPQVSVRCARCTRAEKARQLGFSSPHFLAASSAQSIMLPPAARSETDELTDSSASVDLHPTEAPSPRHKIIELLYMWSPGCRQVTLACQAQGHLALGTPRSPRRSRCLVAGLEREFRLLKRSRHGPRRSRGCG
jgi:hypothetical protein